MKCFLLKEEDFELLVTMMDRDPRYGSEGGSSQVFTKEETSAQVLAHRQFNYQVRTWIDKMKDRKDI